jgi:hypothetical protein
MRKFKVALWKREIHLFLQNRKRSQPHKACIQALIALISRRQLPKGRPHLAPQVSKSQPFFLLPMSSQGRIDSFHDTDAEYITYLELRFNNQQEVGEE